jgi:hypothetical protein
MKYEVPTCESFKYLGAKLREKNSTNVEVKARIAAGNRCLFTVQQILHFRIISRTAKFLKRKTIIRPVMTYAWVLSKENERALNIYS